MLTVTPRVDTEAVMTMHMTMAAVVVVLQLLVWEVVMVMMRTKMAMS